jgi:diguanylate cyclase (GGDEF)-like protein/PAS domain S-box-containing protein
MAVHLRSAGKAVAMRPALAEAEREIFKAVVEAAPCAMIVTDRGGTIAMANREAERLFGHQQEALIGQSVEFLLPHGTRGRHATKRRSFLRRPVARPMGSRRDLLARCRDGRVIPVEVGLSPLRANGSLYVISTIVDLTERKAAEERITRQAAALEEANRRLAELASTDSLTSLWNRRAFLDQLDIQLELAVRKARPLSVLMLDLDLFKSYNDRYGHLAGDEVLMRAARVLKLRARRSDFVARIGGEEFGIILPEADRGGATVLAEQFCCAIRASKWPRCAVTVSVGVATVAFESAVPRPQTPNRSELLAAADRALYRSKKRGRNCVSHVDDSDTNRHRRRPTARPRHGQ